MSASVYVISLVRCVERRRMMTDQMDRSGIAFVFLDAVDGRDLPPGPIAVPGGEPLYPGERACAASHLAAWRRVMHADAPGAFVLEDDAEMRPGFCREILDEVAARARPGEVVLLHSSCRHLWLRRRRRLANWRGTIAYVLGETKLATAYYLTREGAAALVARVEKEGLRFPVDHWCDSTFGHAAWASTLPVLTVKPDLFDQHEVFPSEISSLGRPGLGGAAFSRRRSMPKPFRWRYALRDGVRYLRRLHFLLLTQPMRY